MINDEDIAVRNDAYEKNFEYRRNIETGIRKFSVPKIKFDCNSYRDMIDWNEVDISEPPCIQLYTEEFLREKKHLNEIIEVPGEKRNSSNRIFIFRISMPLTKY